MLFSTAFDFAPSLTCTVRGSVLLGEAVAATLFLLHPFRDFPGRPLFQHRAVEIPVFLFDVRNVFANGADGRDPSICLHCSCLDFVERLVRLGSDVRLRDEFVAVVVGHVDLNGSLRFRFRFLVGYRLVVEVPLSDVGLRGPSPISFPPLGKG